MYVTLQIFSFKYLGSKFDWKWSSKNHVLCKPLNIFFNLTKKLIYNYYYTHIQLLRENFNYYIYELAVRHVDRKTDKYLN